MSRCRMMAAAQAAGLPAEARSLASFVTAALELRLRDPEAFAKLEMQSDEAVLDAEEHAAVTAVAALVGATCLAFVQRERASTFEW